MESKIFAKLENFLTTNRKYENSDFRNELNIFKHFELKGLDGSKWETENNTFFTFEFVPQVVVKWLKLWCLNRRKEYLYQKYSIKIIVRDIPLKYKRDVVGINVTICFPRLYFTVVLPFSPSLTAFPGSVDFRESWIERIYR